MYSKPQNDLKRNERGAAQLTEFAAALSLGIGLLLPLLFVLRFAIGVALAQWVTSRSVQLASDSVSYDQALQKCTEQFESFSKCGLSSLTSFRPVAQGNSSDLDLYVIIQDTSSKTSVTYGPNAFIRTKFDSKGKIFRYMVISHFRLEPFFGKVCPSVFCCPFLTEPIQLSISATSTAEHPESVSISSSEEEGGRI
jgi:hypothetical protein